jgi:hypothetical protein
MTGEKKKQRRAEKRNRGDRREGRKTAVAATAAFNHL